MKYLYDLPRVLDKKLYRPLLDDEISNIIDIICLEDTLKNKYQWVLHDELYEQIQKPLHIRLWQP